MYEKIINKLEEQKVWLDLARYYRGQSTININTLESNAEEMYKKIEEMVDSSINELKENIKF